MTEQDVRNQSFSATLSHHVDQLKDSKLLQDQNQLQKQQGEDRECYMPILDALNKSKDQCSTAYVPASGTEYFENDDTSLVKQSSDETLRERSYGSEDIGKDYEIAESDDDECDIPSSAGSHQDEDPSIVIEPDELDSSFSWQVNLSIADKRR